VADTQSTAVRIVLFSVQLIIVASSVSVGSNTNCRTRQRGLARKTTALTVPVTSLSTNIRDAGASRLMALECTTR
jgi:hypothetical protein